MRINDDTLTPTTSLLADSFNYCYWNGEERYQPCHHAGFIFTDKEAFAAQVIRDYPLGRVLQVEGSAWDHGEGCVIGGPGFGWVALGKESKWIRFPHIGNVWFGHNVELGSNVTIDRGAIGDTEIGSGVKIDNGVHIGHGAYIGRNTLITAHAIIGGSVSIGVDCWIGLGAIIKEHVRVGDGAFIGMGAIVLKDVPAGETWVGNPAHRLEK